MNDLEQQNGLVRASNEILRTEVAKLRHRNAALSEVLREIGRKAAQKHPDDAHCFEFLCDLRLRQFICATVASALALGYMRDCEPERLEGGAS